MRARKSPAGQEAVDSLIQRSPVNGVGWVACLKPTVPQSACPGNAVTVAVVYFKSEDDGDGTYEGRIGHAYLHVDDDASEDKEHDLGLITLARARAIAAEHGADLDIDGPTREEWNG